MTTIDSLTPNQDERVMAALSHISALLPMMGIVPFLVFGAIFIGGFFFIVHGIIGAVMAFQGKDFRYVIIGNRVESFMQSKQIKILNPETGDMHQ